MRQWFFCHQKQIILFSSFFLVSLLSFAVGYITADDLRRTPIIIQMHGIDS